MFTGLELLILLTVLSLMGVIAACKRAKTDQDERTARLLVRHMEDCDWRWPR